MSNIILDRRKNDKKKSLTNRQKFVKRVNKHVKNLIKKTIREGKIEDIVSDSAKKVKVSSRNLKQPWFHYDYSKGRKERILPGNREYIPGDWIPRPEGGEGQGRGNQPGTGEDEDSFEFVISNKEYQDLFFEDLELPDLIKQSLEKITEKKYKREGFQVEGPAGRLNYLQTLRQSVGRRAALRNPRRRELREYEDQLQEIQKQLELATDENRDSLQQKLDEILHNIETVKRRLKAVPFIDNFDLRYNRFDEEDTPITQAVMFCIMDVSGSMGQWEKEMAKRFFMLLYLFLYRTYESVELVFIRHTETAKEVNEEEFFYSRESGGTQIAPAMELTMDVIKNRYPTSKWNIYCCQASDGDVWEEDAGRVTNILNDQLLNMVQYFAYVEIGQDPGPLWVHYAEDVYADNFDQARITDVIDIFPVFRKLFEKEKSHG